MCTPEISRDLDDPSGGLARQAERVLESARLPGTTRLYDLRHSAAKRAVSDAVAGALLSD